METPVPHTADEIRHKLLEQYDAFKPHLQAYHEYAQRAQALGLEYHAARFRETFPQSPVEELTLAATLDARETPKSLDIKLDQLRSAEVVVKRIIFDRVNSVYYLYV